MYNEIIRKLTSFTLLSILLASGVTFALPGAMPVAEASHNANLFVSAENPLFTNTFGGPMVVEVVVNDPSISDTDQSKGAPDVTVNGKRVRMVQATDGLWYAYVADRLQAQTADQIQNPFVAGTTADAGEGLDFGVFCGTGTIIGTLSFTETVGITLPSLTGTAMDTAARNGLGTLPTALLPDCGTLQGAGGTVRSNNVVREPKLPTVASGTATRGQVSLPVAAGGTPFTDVWPFIQLYNFNPTGSVEIKYNKGGGAQTTTLTFDTMDTFSKLSLDRSSYPAGAAVHVALTDGQLNIDPTDEDSWTFATNNAPGAGVVSPATYYQLFNENGQISSVGAADGSGQNIVPTLGQMMFEDNGVLRLNPAVSGAVPVVAINDNADTIICPDPIDTTCTAIPAAGVSTAASAFTGDGGAGAGTVVATAQPMTFVETGANTGIFTNYDENDNANLDIAPGALRGTSASIDYNKKATSIVVGFAFGTLDVKVDGEWNSGEEVPVTLVDADANLNTRADEDLDVFNPAVTIIPAMRIGTPNTLASNTAGLVGPAAVLSPVGSAIFAAPTSGAVPLGFGAGQSTPAGPVMTVTIPAGGVIPIAGMTVDRFSDVARLTWPAAGATAIPADTVADGAGFGIVIPLNTDLENLRANLVDVTDTNVPNISKGFNLLNYDIRGIINPLTGVTATNIDIYLLIDPTTPAAGVAPAAAGSSVGLGNFATAAKALAAIRLTGAVGVTNPQGIVDLTSQLGGGPLAAAATSIDAALFTGLGTGPSGTVDKDDSVALLVILDSTSATAAAIAASSVTPIAADFFAFGLVNDADKDTERINNAIYRFQLEETGDNTSTFIGSAEYTMLNQANSMAAATFANLQTIDNQVKFVVGDDLNDEDAPRINYLDVGGDGVATQISDQQDAPTHSGVVSFDKDNYKIADTVTVTVEDQDLNVDTDLIDIYTTVAPTITTPPTNAGVAVAAGVAVGTSDVAADAVGVTGLGTYLDGTTSFGRLLDITFDDERWAESASDEAGSGGPFLTDCANLDGAGAAAFDDGLFDSGFTLVETGPATGIFKGDFQIPSNYCSRNAIAAGAALTSPLRTPATTGVDLEVNYVDFRDASGQLIEVGDGAGVRANTGSISLDRTVYPLPWGVIADFGGFNPIGSTPNRQAYFPVHETAVGLGTSTSVDPAGPAPGSVANEFLPRGVVTTHIRVNDPDFDVSATGEDKINVPDPALAVAGRNGGGPVQITISRGANILTLGTAGGPVPVPGLLTNGGVTAATRELGPLVEIAPNAGIFEIDVPILHTDGPSDPKCPVTDFYQLLRDVGAAGIFIAPGVFPPLGDPSLGGFVFAEDRFADGVGGGPVISAAILAALGPTAPGAGAGLVTQPVAYTGDHCILQGDILTVQYTDPTDASGKVNTVTDSATFDLRNGVLQSDKSVYIIGSDMIMTIIDPDLNLDTDVAETYTLDLIEWDSDAATLTMGPLGGSAAQFDPEPNAFRETGDDTGVFQIVAEIPSQLPAAGTRLDRGEQIDLEYQDWGPSGADFVGDEEEDIKLTVYTSNFGATVELDQKVYTWTDKVFITIVAPDHNFDSNLIDTIGDTSRDKIIVATRGNKLSQYQLTETGTDTGIFTGEVILTGFAHDADGDATTGAIVAGVAGSDVTAAGPTPATGGGPTNGLLPADDDDGLTVSFEFTEDETVVGSALIRWNIGEVSFLEASYPATGQGIVRVIDPDMNLNPEAIDNFDIDVWSDSDAGGIDLTVTETNEATGIFEGTVFFTVTDESSGHRLRVAEGDTVTAEYSDNTLPNPYTTADELQVSATTFIGSIVPPLERAPASNPRIVDSSGTELDEVNVDQQIQITADLANGQDRDQAFAYLVQLQDENGVTVSLSWITGSLAPGQSLNPAQSWTPTSAGTYNVQIFVWESVDNPDALSPPVSTTITVV